MEQHIGNAGYPVRPGAAWFPGVHWASIGRILPAQHDLDGHEFRFYTMQHHTELDADVVTTINDPRETAERRERAAAQLP